MRPNVGALVVASVTLVVASVALVAASAHATPVTSPDEVCSPGDDPCIISTVVEVDATYPLDFGTRTVRIATGGKLVGTVDLSCGAFEVDVGNTTPWIDLSIPVGVARATINARRSCAGDSLTPCFNDTTCVNLTLGTCSVGDGGIRVVGKIAGKNAPSVDFNAAGDVAVDGDIVVKGSKTRPNGGTVSIDSGTGSMELAGEIIATAGENIDYGSPGFGGGVFLRAAVDIVVLQPIWVDGASGFFEASAGNDLTIQASVLGGTLPGSDFIGGTVDLDAGNNINILNNPEGSTVVLDVSGDSRFGSYGLYGGPGGYGFFDAGGDITVGDKVRMAGDSGASRGMYVDDLPIGACWYFNAGGALDVGSPITARGRGPHGTGCTISMTANDGISIGRRAVLTTSSMYGADINVVAYRASPITLDGKLDVKGKKRTSYGNFYGYGANVFVSGGNVTVNGRILNGGGSGAGGIRVDACDLHLGPKGAIDAAQNRQYSSPGYTEILTHTMTAEKGSKLLAKQPYGVQTIRYRDTAPVLQGKVTPPAVIVADPYIDQCADCGNDYLEFGEGCDDGNLDAGDGCSDLCQIE